MNAVNREGMNSNVNEAQDSKRRSDKENENEYETMGQDWAGARRLVSLGRLRLVGS